MSAGRDRHQPANNFVAASSVPFQRLNDLLTEEEATAPWRTKQEHATKRVGGSASGSRALFEAGEVSPRGEDAKAIRRCYRLRRPRHKGRAERRATGPAGFTLAPRPLRGRRTPESHRKATAEGQRRRPHGRYTSMRTEDTELELLRREVTCAALLEHWSSGWRLDRRESTRRALKYRRGKGEILIINHDGHGWWDPLSSAKGDVFDLVQHLDPSLKFVQVCRELRRLIGVAPALTEALRPSLSDTPDLPVAHRWRRRPRLRPGSAAWSYLAEQRRIPASILIAATEADIVRGGSFGCAWFAHRDADGAVTHVEIRGPDYRGSLKGGTKTLFQFGRAGKGACRLAVTEAPIDALSLAVVDGYRADTLYVATGGGIGPGTILALQDAMSGIEDASNARLVAATDANRAGDRYAGRLSEIAAGAGVAAERLRPIGATDWNDILRGRAG